MVDLKALRGAVASLERDAFPAKWHRKAAVDGLGAVLDAPVVWWCEEHDTCDWVLDEEVHCDMLESLVWPLPTPPKGDSE